MESGYCSKSSRGFFAGAEFLMQKLLREMGAGNNCGELGSMHEETGMPHCLAAPADASNRRDETL